MVKIAQRITIITAVIIVSFGQINIVWARSIEDIQNDINTQNQALQQTQNNLNKAKSDLQGYQNALTNVQAGLPQINLQIANIQKEIDYNNLQKDLYNEKKNLLELESQDKQEKEVLTLKESYVQWRSNLDNQFSILNSDYDIKKADEFSKFIIGDQQSEISSLSEDLANLQQSIDGFNQKLGDLNNQINSLQQQKAQLEAQASYYNGQINSANGKVLGLQNNVQSLQTSISSLSAEQKAAIQRENQILANSGNNQSVGHESTTDQSVQNVQAFYFYGQGRTLYQGHGVGMSQWGMYGMAQHGISYSDILKFYYTNTSIGSGYENRTINVQGYGTMNIEDYTAGQSEISPKACGTQAQVNQNPAKYALYNGNIWSCWPEEAIKAQVVAYRTYALYHGTICTTPACQHYNGSQNTRWAVDETKGQVLLYHGQMVDAIYASDNSQGFGTANNDTIFQTYGGNGTAYPYLRAVNDNQYDANPSHWNTWAYKTKNYTMNDFNRIINDESNDSSIGGLRTFIANLRSSIGGNIVSISFERDPSNRVKKIWFKGSNGNSASLGGYWFKYAWNVWQSSHGGDYIYSQTVFLHDG